MKRWMIACSFLAIGIFFPHRSAAQAEELAQLALNIEKLSELKKILTNMYQGYTILTNGYNRVRDIANDNYNLHQVFLDGLYLVSPAVRNYRRVGDIISYQAKLVSEYRSAFARFKTSGKFSEEDLAYLESVYNGLLNESASNLEELLIIITAGQARMSDDERLEGIDRIFKSVEDKLIFIRGFNQSTQIYAMQKGKEKSAVSSLRKLFELP